MKENKARQTHKEKLSVRVDAALIPQLKALAEEDGRSFSGYVNHLLKQYIREQEYSVGSKTS